MPKGLSFAGFSWSAHLVLGCPLGLQPSGCQETQSVIKSHIKTKTAEIDWLAAVTSQEIQIKCKTQHETKQFNVRTKWESVDGMELV